MERTSSRKKIAVIIAVTALLAVVLIATLAAEKWVTYNPTPVKSVTADELDSGAQPPLAIDSTENSPVKFSLPCGFYSKNQKLYLSAQDAVRIHYTKDGSDPRTDGKRYSENGISLKIDGESDCKIYTINACAEYADGSFSDVVTQSYLLGTDIYNRFDCLVFSISIDPDYLYNYDDGIFILGKMRDDYLATKPTKEIQPTDPANWNQRGMAGERPAFVEVYEHDGECVISQKCGMRIFGGWSRANDQKNIRLFARSEYDEVNNRFRYEFFPDATDSNGDKLKSAKKLALRACANDNGALFARDDTMSYLAMPADIDAKHSRPAAVFLNGEYYGFVWLQEVFSGDWLDHKYNVEDGTWDILKGCEYMIKDDPDEDISAARDDFVEMQSYAYKDLTDDETFAELESMLDIDNFLTYNAINSYIGNGDWPNNNYKVYRYVSGDGSLSQRQDRLDGRWRYMLFDTDFALGLYGHDFLEKNICYLFDDEYFGRFPENWDLDVHDDGEKYWRSDLLITMSKRDDVREKFTGIVLDIMNWYYSPERVTAKLDEMHTLRLHELVAAGNNGTANIWSVDRELGTAKDWITKRPYSAKRQLAQIFPDYYDSESVFTIRAIPTANATIKINTCEIAPDEEFDFNGEYFVGMEIPLSVTVAPGYKFDSWEINGEKVYEQSLSLSSEKYGDNIKIRLNVSCESAGIDISEVCYKGGSDYIILKNLSDKALSTKGLTLADSDSGEAFILPTAEIKAGRTLKIICKNYSRSDALGSIECDFSLKEGETLVLKDSTGKTVRELYLRDAAKNSALKLDEMSGEYVAYTPYPKTRILEAELPSWGNWGGGWNW